MKLGPDRSNILLYKSTVIFAFLWSYYWNHPLTAKVSGIYGRQAIPRHDLFRIIPPSLDSPLVTSVTQKEESNI